MEAVTEVDIAAAFRGKYRTYRQAIVVMREFALEAFAGPVDAGTPPEARRRVLADPGALVGAVAAEIARQHAMAEVPVMFAQRGDLILAHDGRRSVMSILALNGRELAVLSDCLMRAPISAARRAWRV